MERQGITISFFFFFALKHYPENCARRAGRLPRRTGRPGHCLATLEVVQEQGLPFAYIQLRQRLCLKLLQSKEPIDIILTKGCVGPDAVGFNLGKCLLQGLGQKLGNTQACALLLRQERRQCYSIVSMVF